MEKDKLPLSKQVKPVNTTMLYRVSKKFFNKVKSVDDLYKPEFEDDVNKYLVDLVNIFK